MVAKAPTRKDAMEYLKAVKEKYQEKPAKYDEFIHTMRHFKAQKLDIQSVISKVEELLKEHPDLILGFNIFLPLGYQIRPLEKHDTEFEKALSFVNKVKTRLGEDSAYRSFLEILVTYEKENKPITAVHHEVATLLQDHPDLLVEFTKYLPASASFMFVNVGFHGKKDLYGKKD